MAIVFVELNDDITDKDEFWAKFKHRAAAFKSELPTGVLALVTNDDFGDTSAMLITIESKDKTYRELENYLDELKDRLRSIDAVSNLRTFGVQKEQISVYLDPAKLARYAIGNTTLATKLLAQGFTTMSGAVDNGKFVAPIHIPAGACYTSKRCGACCAGIFRAGFLHYEQRNEMFGPLYGDARGEQYRSNGRGGQ